MKKKTTKEYGHVLRMNEKMCCCLPYAVLVCGVPCMMCSVAEVIPCCLEISAGTTATF